MKNRRSRRLRAGGSRFYAGVSGSFYVIRHFGLKRPVVRSFA